MIWGASQAMGLGILHNTLLVITIESKHTDVLFMQVIREISRYLEIKVIKVPLDIMELLWELVQLDHKEQQGIRV